MGRNKLYIDRHQFEELCKIQCTKREIACVLNVSDDTVERWCARTYKQKFEDVFAYYREGGRASLRRSQFIMAQKNPTMSIWLGKQYLGQKDESTVNNNFAPITFVEDLKE